jgi:predicted dinucleotide-binding enzyme
VRASSGTAREAVDFGDVVLLATPLKATPELAKLGDLWKGKIVLDATNPYPERDGDAAREAIARGQGSSVWTQSKLPGARVVKAFNMQRYTALQSEAHNPDALAIVLASDDEDALRIAEKLVRDAGFEPVVVGSLVNGRAFDPGTPHYANGARASELHRERPATIEQHA